MAGKRYVPPEKMTVEEIEAEIAKEFDRWNDLANGACRDPGWCDGVNMNLVRNHIIFWYRILKEKMDMQYQTSLFDDDPRLAFLEKRRAIPPEVPNRYVVRDKEYAKGIEERMGDSIVWGKKGEYCA